MLRLDEAEAGEAVELPFPALGPADAGAESGCSRVREIAFCDAGARPGILYILHKINSHFSFNLPF